jgi:RNA polymerase-interacting CarD/CdnL/TRCF family regulator
MDEIAAASEGDGGLPTLRVLDLANMVRTMVAYVNQRGLSRLEKKLIAANLSILLEQPEEGAKENA